MSNQGTDISDDTDTSDSDNSDSIGQRLEFGSHVHRYRHNDLITESGQGTLLRINKQNHPIMYSA